MEPKYSTVGTLSFRDGNPTLCKELVEKLGQIGYGYYKQNSGFRILKRNGR